MKSLPVSPVELRDIFALFGGQYRQEHKLPLQQHRALFAIQHCRTAALGGHVDVCDKCGHQRISYNSCRNRHCPKCQGLNRSRWTDKLSSSLLPVRYFHIVFTIPSELNRLALVNQRCLYNILFKAASESLLLLAKDNRHLGAVTGLVAVLHTWGQNLMEHPHLHTIVPAGGWNETSKLWKASRKNFFIPVKVISSVFRGKFLSMLKQAYHNRRLLFEGEIKPLALKNNFKQLLDVLYHKDWVVYAKKPFKNSAHLVRYLGRYSHRVAIANQRIEGIEGEHVAFRWKDYKDHHRWKTMKLHAPEFIRRFLLHILPKGFCKIRYYGIFASRNKNAALDKCRKSINRPAIQPRFENLPWQEILRLICGVDVLLCPVCKKGTMLTVADLKDYRAPPL